MNEFGHKSHGPYARFFKRPLDILFSTLALLCLSPLFILLALLVRWKLGSPALFKQPRPGLGGRIFHLHKFRSMTNARNVEGNLLPDELRLTPFGRFLRATSLDELPELFNILKGDMSIVGPRPLLVQYLPYYTPRERTRHDVRPGLTGLAQINGRNYLQWDQRLELDAQYVERLSFGLDATIVLKTIAKVLRREGVAEKRITPLDQARQQEK